MPELFHEQDGPAVPFQEETEPVGTPAAPNKGQIPAELLKAFEQNYRSRRRGRWMKYAAVSMTACLAVFAWNQASRRPEHGGTISRTRPVQPAEQRPVAAPVPPAQKSTPPAPSYAAIIQKARPAEHRPVAAPVPPVQKSTLIPGPPYVAIVQKPHPDPRKPAAGAATASKLPAFIPEKGRDSAYSRQKPGWERYTDAKYEFRILRAGNQIKTVQVLASTPDTISESFLKSVLGDISGKNTYQETSQTEEHGFLVKRGSAGPGVKILIYTQKSRIRAFVVSIS